MNSRGPRPNGPKTNHTLAFKLDNLMGPDQQGVPLISRPMSALTHENKRWRGTERRLSTSRDNLVIVAAAVDNILVFEARRPAPRELVDEIADLNERIELLKATNFILVELLFAKDRALEGMALRHKHQIQTR